MISCASLHGWPLAFTAVGVSFGVAACIFAAGWSWKHSGLTLTDPQEDYRGPSV